MENDSVMMEADPRVVDNVRRMWAIAMDEKKPTHERILAFDMVTRLMIASRDPNIYEKAGIDNRCLSSYSLAELLVNMSGGFAGGGWSLCSRSAARR